MGAKTPCFGCNERQVGCHSTCEKYQEYDKQNKQMQEQRKEQSEIEYYIAKK